MKKLFLCCALALLSLPSNALVVLQYHHIDDHTPPSTSTRPEVFKQHLELLKNEQMVIVDLMQALKDLDAGKALPDKAVAITFDDAYLSIYSTAWPLLKKEGWPFTIFVNPKQIDAKLPNMISWEQLKELQDQGVIIANHTQTHPYLIEADLNKNIGGLDTYLNQEINGAEQRLKEKLGSSHKLLAYPYGEYNLAIMNWLKQQGYTAFGQQSGAIGVTTNRQALPRYPAGGVYANPETLKNKLYTLPFAIRAKQYQEPVLAANNPPKFTLDIPIDDFLPKQIQCYSGNEGALATAVTVQDGVAQVTTQAVNPINTGRDRYNCTAPSLKQRGFYYWYSQQWINPTVPNR